MIDISVIVPVAGVGKRFGGKKKKQFYEIKKKPIIFYTFSALNRAFQFKNFVIGASKDDFEFLSYVAISAGIDPEKLIFTEGGKERADTVLNALKSVKTEYCAVHDAVRPFITKEMVCEVISCATNTDNGGAICAVGVRDTVKQVVSNGKVRATLDREQIYLAHTPQVFKTIHLIKALERAKELELIVTDEASACEEAGLTVKISPSTVDNIKITAQNDLTLVDILIERYFSDVL